MPTPQVEEQGSLNAEAFIWETQQDAVDVLHSYEPPLNLKHFHVTLCSHTGAYATLPLRAASNEQYAVRLHRPDGSMVREYLWYATHDLVCFDWLDEAHVMALLGNGQLFIYSLFDRPVSSQRLELDSPHDKVVMAVLEHGTLLCCVTEFSPVRLRRMADQPLDLATPPTCMAVVPGPPGSPFPGVICALSKAPAASSPAAGDASAAPRGSTLALIRRSTVERVECPCPGGVVHMSVHPYGTLLALFTSMGSLLVADAALRHIVLRLDVGQPVAPWQMMWYGETDTVVLSWQAPGWAGRAARSRLGCTDLTLVQVPSGRSRAVRFTGHACLRRETDGLRVLCATGQALLRATPRSVQSIFEVASIDPPAMLKDAARAITCGDAVSDMGGKFADDSLSELVGAGTLAPAALDCVRAACFVPTAPQQQAVLVAAQLACSVLVRHDDTAAAVVSDALAHAVRALRVTHTLNQRLRLPITCLQVLRLGMPGVIGLLCRLGLHTPATALCAAVRVKPTPAVTAWLAAALSSTGSLRAARDEEAAARVASFLRSADAAGAATDYAALAHVAARMERRGLALRLLALERSPVKRVTLLLVLREFAEALRVACLEPWVQLLPFVVAQVAQRVTDENLLLELLAPFPLALEVHVGRLEREEPLRAFSLLLRANRPADAAAVRMALVRAAMQAQPQQLEAAIEHANAAAEVLNGVEGEKALAKAAQQWVKLLLLQSEFTPLMAGASVVRTVESSVARRHPEADALAVRLRKEMDMSDTGWRWAQLRGLVMARDMPALRKLAANEKGGAGLSDFAEACNEAGLREEAVEMANMIKSMKKRLAVLGAIGAWWTAAEVALQHRKFDELEGIMDKCGDETLRARILRAMEK